MGAFIMILAVRGSQGIECLEKTMYGKNQFWGLASANIGN